MLLVLPPKRFESTDDPRFDPIRPRQWFAKLETRRAKLPFLKEAYRQWDVVGLSQLQAAANAGVDPRELRDYAAFIRGKAIGWDNFKDERTANAILMDAVARYRRSNAEYHLRHYIEEICPLWGRNPRPITELYDVCPLWGKDL